MRPKVDLLAHRNVWKGGVTPGKRVPQLKRALIPYILLLYVKRIIDLKWPYLRSSDMYSIHYYTAKQGSCVSCRGIQ